MPLQWQCHNLGLATGSATGSVSVAQCQWLLWYYVVRLSESVLVIFKLRVSGTASASGREEGPGGFKFCGDSGLRRPIQTSLRA